MKYSETRTIEVSAYAHKLSAGLVNALIIVAREEKRTGGVVNINQLESLTHNQRANFQKLKHWRFVFSPNRGGGYFLSEIGKKFLSGKSSETDMVASLGNQTLSRKHKCWETSKKKPTLRTIYEILDMSEYTYYKDYEEFAAEKVPTFQSRFF